MIFADENFLNFALTSLIIELTPGPNMAYLAVLSAVHGRRTGFSATLGIALGLSIIGVASALGLAALISSSVVVYEILRWGGAAFLLWLAWEGWREAPETSPARMSSKENDSKYFKRGLLTNILNPKAAIFYVAILPTFVDRTKEIFHQTLVLSLVYVSIATLVHTLIVALAGSARPFLENPHRSRFARRALSVVLALVAGWFAYTTAR